MFIYVNKFPGFLLYEGKKTQEYTELGQAKLPYKL